jgi:hypothetical protein
MPTLTISEDQLFELARQLPPAARQSLALALLREQGAPPSLEAFRRRARPELAAVLRERGLDIERMSPDEVDEAIQRICQEH